MEKRSCYWSDFNRVYPQRRHNKVANGCNFCTGAHTNNGLPNITEAQADTILGTYGDANEVSPWAKMEFAIAINGKIIEGIGQSMLASQELATRAQATTVVYKVLDQIGGF